MQPKNFQNRRLVRMQAVCTLYAYHTSIKVQYAKCLDSINTDFPQNTILGQPVDKKSQDIDRAEAIQLFTSFVLNKGVSSQVNISNQRAFESAKKAYAAYKSAKDQEFAIAILKLDKIEAKINKTVLQILVLLLEWRNHAMEKNTVEKADAKTKKILEKFSKNITLEKFNKNKCLQIKLQSFNLFLDYERDNIELWFRNEFLTKIDILENYEQLQDLDYLLEMVSQIVFNSVAITDFLKNKYIWWGIFHNLVKSFTIDYIKFLDNIQEANYTIDIPQKNCISKDEIAFYKMLLNSSLSHESELEKVLASQLRNWSTERILILDKIIVKLGICEILFLEDIPRRVSINEYIDIASIYGSEKSPKFINGILDAINTNKSSGYPLQPL